MGKEFFLKIGPSHSHIQEAAPLSLQQSCERGRKYGLCLLTGPGISFLLAGPPRRPWFQRHSGTTWATWSHGEWFCSLVWEDFLPSSILCFCEAAGCYKEPSALLTVGPAEHGRGAASEPPQHICRCPRVRGSLLPWRRSCCYDHCTDHSGYTEIFLFLEFLRFYMGRNSRTVRGLCLWTCILKQFYFSYSEYHAHVAEKQQRDLSDFTESAVVKVTVSSHVMLHAYLLF